MARIVGREAYWKSRVAIGLALLVTFVLIMKSWPRGENVKGLDGESQISVFKTVSHQAPDSKLGSDPRNFMVQITLGSGDTLNVALRYFMLFKTTVFSNLLS